MARKKFKFVEMFIDPQTGAPFEDTGSPKWIEPKCKEFSPFMGHQIAKIEYEEKTVKNVTYKVSLRFLPQLEMRPSSNAPSPVESREAPPTSSFPGFSEPP